MTLLKSLKALKSRERPSEPLCANRPTTPARLDNGLNYDGMGICKNDRNIQNLLVNLIKKTHIENK